MNPERELLQKLIAADPSDFLAIAALQDRAQGLLHPKNPVRMVLDKYAEYHPRAKPGDLELKKIQLRLSEGWTGDDLCSAIDGCHRSPFHCGENAHRKKHQGLAMILRDSSQVQKFVEIAVGEGDGEGAVMGATRRSLEAANRLLGG